MLPQRHKSSQLAQPDHDHLTFNFAAALAGRASSAHTSRAYYRWVDTYLVDTADMKRTTGDARDLRMTALPIAALQETLTTAQLRAWLGTLTRRGHGKQGLSQARAAIVTLSDLLAEAQWLDEREAAAMARVRPPRAEDGQRPGRWLSLDQIKLLITASADIATSDYQAVRNQLVLTVLCTMALRREELSQAKWGDLSVQNNRMVLRVHGKGRKSAVIDVPRPVQRLVERWQRIVAAKERPPDHSPLIRRVWKGGRISRNGLTADGIWLLVERSAHKAGVGHVAPHDLRRSVAGALHESGTPIEKISRLLRHSNVAVTERYLNRLPQKNEGAVLMSDILGFDDDADEWQDYE